MMRSYSMPLYEQLHIVFIWKIPDDELLEIGYCLVCNKACWESVCYCITLVFVKEICLNVCNIFQLNLYIYI
jgi:hypothetical protein